MVEDHISADLDFTRITEYLEMQPEKISIACKRKILNDSIDENETDSENMHCNLCTYCIAEASNSKDSNDLEESTTANSAEAPSTTQTEIPSTTQIEAPVECQCKRKIAKWVKNDIISKRLKNE